MSKSVESEYDLTKRVEVSWVDASCVQGWHGPREALEHMPMPVKTLGYLVRKTKDFISVTQTQTEDSGRANTMAIPLSWVKKIRTLK